MNTIYYQDSITGDLYIQDELGIRKLVRIDAAGIPLKEYAETTVTPRKPRGGG